ncbi:MAG: hypothetical protein WA324_16115 [Bryobacteraceae bacterium]
MSDLNNDVSGPVVYMSERRSCLADLGGCASGAPSGHAKEGVNGLSEGLGRVVELVARIDRTKDATGNGA